MYLETSSSLLAGVVEFAYFLDRIHPYINKYQILKSVEEQLTIMRTYFGFGYSVHQTLHLQFAVEEPRTLSVQVGFAMRWDSRKIHLFAVVEVVQLQINHRSEVAW